MLDYNGKEREKRYFEDCMRICRMRGLPETVDAYLADCREHCREYAHLLPERYWEEVERDLRETAKSLGK